MKIGEMVKVTAAREGVELVTYEGATTDLRLPKFELHRAKGVGWLIYRPGRASHCGNAFNTGPENDGREAFTLHVGDARFRAVEGELPDVFDLFRWTFHPERL